MKKHFLHYLCDPENQKDLVLDNAVIVGDDIKSGILRSDINEYPIINGIPRFVKNESYSDNFGYQWNRWARLQFEDQNIGGPMHKHTLNMFKSITGFSKENLYGKTVLDLGCGSGRFTDVVLDMGAIVIALDYSSAIDAAKSNFDQKKSNVLFIQADALKMPIKNISIDACFTIGVLHHTPSPAQGVIEVHRVLKRDGTFAIRVYDKKGFYGYPMVTLWRKIFMQLKPVLKFYPPLVYSYFFCTIAFILGKIWRPLTYPLRIIFPTVWCLDYRWSVLDTFDAITTSYQSGHTPLEVQSWLTKAGFVKIVQRNDNSNDFTGKK